MPLDVGFGPTANTREKQLTHGLEEAGLVLDWINLGRFWNKPRMALVDSWCTVLQLQSKVWLEVQTWEFHQVVVAVVTG
jgi:hypothetical protein